MKKKSVKILLIILVILVAGIIFYLSSQNATQSTILSSGFLSLLHLSEDVEEFVRETAHGIEYAGLSFLLYCLIHYCGRTEKKWMLMNILICFIYAVTDEIHQIFVPGRAFEWLDISIDTAGAVIGMIGMAILIKIFSVIKSKFSDENTDEG